jgi:uncharacterized protein YfbU (UPF0304 family)
MDIFLTPPERLILINQYEIIRKLSPDREHECVDKLRILWEEKTAEYPYLFEGLSAEPVATFQNRVKAPLNPPGKS